MTPAWLLGSIVIPRCEQTRPLRRNIELTMAREASRVGIMQLRKMCNIGCFLVGALLAQTEDGLKSRIANVRYPALAEHARIQGDVRLEISPAGITLLSGHPLLARAAVDNAKTLSSTLAPKKNPEVTYHFVFVDTATSVATLTTVKRGNSIERAVLRLFGFKPQKVVHTYQCVDGVAPMNKIKTDGAVIEIWIYGRSLCLQTSSATLVAELLKRSFEAKLQRFVRHRILEFE